MHNHIDHIRSERPRLSALAQKVARVHGLRHPELVELAESVELLFRELEPNLEKAERSAVSGLEAEYVEAGRLLAGIRKLTGGYRPPQDACNSYLALFHGLERFEADLHELIQLEKDILHSRIAPAPGTPKEGEEAPGSCCGFC